MRPGFHRNLVPEVPEELGLGFLTKQIRIAEISFAMKGEKFPFLAEKFSCVETLEAMAVIIIICKNFIIESAFRNN